MSVHIFVAARHWVSHIALSSLQVVQELSSNVVVIEKLENFQYKDKNGKDFGENVRHRAKQLAELIIDPDRIREERRKVRRAAAEAQPGACHERLPLHQRRLCTAKPAVACVYLLNSSTLMLCVGIRYDGNPYKHQDL
jgi:hypothetical protein